MELFLHWPGAKTNKFYFFRDIYTRLSYFAFSDYEFFKMNQERITSPLYAYILNVRSWRKCRVCFTGNSHIPEAKRYFYREGNACNPPDGCLSEDAPAAAAFLLPASLSRGRSLSGAGCRESGGGAVLRLRQH